MALTVQEQLLDELGKIDRPGSFCVSGSAPPVLPGLEVKGIGTIGLPLTPGQAEELKSRCAQAPYGKGVETVVDTSVRRVWRLMPDQFELMNPDWELFLNETVEFVEEGLGLAGQKLERQLYDLLLYEAGSFFLPHRDGEKLERMVATLVICLPSRYEGGQLVVRHEGHAETVDFSALENSQFRTQFAAFYADCEHEILPLKRGYRLCLIYNLALAKSQEGILAPRSEPHIVEVSRLLKTWAGSDTAHKMVITLDHQYTQAGLAWDTLKGVDGVKAHVLKEAASQAGCQVHLALLTFWESGSAEYVDDGYSRYERRRSRYSDDEDDSDQEYEMGEVFDTSLSVDHWIDAEGNRPAFGEMDLEEADLLDRDSLTDVDPEEEFEGNTGNAGMTLERWYRHAAIVLWPEQRHFDILCGNGSPKAVAGLELWLKRWQLAEGDKADKLETECKRFAERIIDKWPEDKSGKRTDREAPSSKLFASVLALDAPELIGAFLSKVLIRDATARCDDSLPTLFVTYGWNAFRAQIAAVFAATSAGSLDRNVHLLEQICTAHLEHKHKSQWLELCGRLAAAMVSELQKIDTAKPAQDDWNYKEGRLKVLVSLVKSLAATRQLGLLSQVVEHVLETPKKYPLIDVRLTALERLVPWFREQVIECNAAISRLFAVCRQELESLTAEAPQPPVDFRRDARIGCKCEDCAELKTFLKDKQEETHRFRMNQGRRNHLDTEIRSNHCDLDCTTDQRGSPQTLVCTKNKASFNVRLKKFYEDQQHLAKLLALDASLP